MSTFDTENELCHGCVYYPPNLPPSAYSQQDYEMLQAKTCSFDHEPGDESCSVTRKTSCSLLDLDHLKQSTL